MKTNRKKQPSNELKPMYLRLPNDIKERLDVRAKQMGISQAMLVAQILVDALGDDMTTRDARIDGWLERIS